jgi:hypothetical protein
MRASDFNGVVFCEDIRREITEKLFFIGVYTGDIVMQTFPGSIQLAVWTEIRNLTAGQHLIELRFGIEKKGWLGAQVHLEAAVEGPASFVVPPMQVLVDEDTEFVLQVKNGDEFETIRKKRIIRGQTVEPFNVSIGEQPRS